MSKRTIIPSRIGRWGRGVAMLGVVAAGALSGGCVQEPPKPAADILPQADNPQEEVTDLQVLRYKSRAYLDRNNAVMALKYLRLAQPLAPDDGEILTMLGRTYAMMGRLEAALASLKRARELLPDDSEVAYGMGVVLAQEKRYPEAEAFIREAMDAKGFKQRDDALYHLALIQEGQGNHPRMLELLEEALKNNPVHVPSHLKLAAHFHGKGLYEQERRHLQEVLAETPDDVEVMGFLVESHLRDGQKERAVLLLRNIIMLASPESEAGARASKRLSMLGEVTP